MARRDQGSGAVYFEHIRGSDCRDSKHHRSCRGRWVGSLSLGRDGSGRRNRRPVTGRTKTEVLDKLRALHEELGLGIQSKANYTVRTRLMTGSLRHLLAGQPRQSARSMSCSSPSLPRSAP